MPATSQARPITIFTPSFADEDDTNAQNLTVKQIVARLSPEQFRVVMFFETTPDPRIAARPNTRLLRWKKGGNTIRMLMHFVTDVPDIYFFPREGPLDAAVLLARRHLRLRTGVVTYIVSGGLEAGIPRPSMARNIDEGDSVVANSKYLSRILEELRHSPVSTVHDGIDCRYYYPSDPPKRISKKPVVLYAGSFRKYKRVDQVVYQAARRQDVEFRVAGTGEQERACRQLAQQLGCANTTFLGHLSQKKLGEEMRNADIFFFPSVLEGHPQVLIQAAACGLPCIAMSCYCPEYVVNRETGFLSGSDEDLPRYLDLLLENGALRQSMSEAAIAHARNFDWERITEQWSGVFKEVVARRRSFCNTISRRLNNNPVSW